MVKLLVMALGIPKDADGNGKSGKREFAALFMLAVAGFLVWKWDTLEKVTQGEIMWWLIAFAVISCLLAFGFEDFLKHYSPLIQKAAGVDQQGQRQGLVGGQEEQMPNFLTHQQNLNERPPEATNFMDQPDPGRQPHPVEDRRQPDKFQEN